MASRRLLRSLVPFISAVVPVTAVLLAGSLSAAPPGPWTFIPPPGGSSAPKIVLKMPGSASAPAPTASTGKPVDGLERARLSTVVIERSKKPIALGVLLADKPVVVTALSPIALGGGTGDLEVRYPETGVSTKAKLVHEDGAWDLALLVPASSKGIEGAKPSDADPLSPTATFSTFVLLKTGKLQAQTTAVLGRRDYLSPEGEVLKDALSIDTKNVAIGTPLVDGQGGVVALVGRACAPGSNKPQAGGGKTPCVPSLFGTPLANVRKFLKSAPPIKPPTPWLGVVAQADKVGVRIIAIQAGSPASIAGLKAWDGVEGDAILAIDGAIVKTADELSEQVKKHGVGDEAKMLVVRSGAVREVKVVLKSSDESPDAPPPKPATPPPAPTNVTPLPPLPPIFMPAPPPKKPGY
jgi:S1-C subfamily serine protease